MTSKKKQLVIVESPTKAKTIGQFLGDGYVVASSYGHVRDLPKSLQHKKDLPNTEIVAGVGADFSPRYIIPAKAKENVKEIRKLASKASGVILASDEDREGEAISWHLAQVLEGKGSKTKRDSVSVVEGKPLSRIVFHEITSKAIKAALEHPRAIDQKMVDAQQARRILDRLVGFKLSPFLWKKIAPGLSAGRVQSVALRLVVDREKEIRIFKPEEYWTVAATLKTKSGKTFETAVAKRDGEPLDKFAFKSETDAKTVADILRKAQLTVSSIEQRESTKTPPAPFTTSTLQQEAAKRLHYSSKKTMLLAQRLYEQGFITYMRTDSVNLSSESTEAAKNYLASTLGSAYAEAAPRKYAAKSKLAQEAHEAIRPSDPNLTPDTIRTAEAAEQKVYQLIWQRFMGSQMPNARINSTAIEVMSDGKPSYALRATGQRIAFDGYLKIWPQQLVERELPAVSEGETLKLESITPSQHFTEPPPRYSEATLIKALEAHGVGRPSTYAPTISLIQTRNYVFKEQGRFKPTEIGEMVMKVLEEHFPKIVDIDFTAKMEDELDGVAEGRTEWHKLIGDFYGPFSENLAEKYADVAKLIEDTKTDEVCEKCGKPMVIKMSRFGKFMGCSGFPECRNTKKVVGAGGKDEPKKTGVPCPECKEGEIVERRVSRGRARGKMFWGCSRYPVCKFAKWERPEGVPAPAEGEKTTPEATPTAAENADE